MLQMEGNHPPGNLLALRACGCARFFSVAPKIDFDRTVLRQIDVAAVSGNQEHARRPEAEVARGIACLRS